MRIVVLTTCNSRFRQIVEEAKANEKQYLNTTYDIDWRYMPQDSAEYSSRGLRADQIIIDSQISEMVNSNNSLRWLLTEIVFTSCVPDEYLFQVINTD